jgi:hypothetical protein
VGGTGGASSGVSVFIIMFDISWKEWQRLEFGNTRMESGHTNLYALYIIIL